MTQIAQQTRIVNGVNVDQLFGTIDAINENASIANFHFRAQNRWLGGGHNQTIIRDFYGAGQNQDHLTPFVLDADEPAVLLGTDLGANPVEHLLNALAACVTTSLVYHAAARGIRVDAVESWLEGDLDLRGFLGISDDVPKGYKEVRMMFKVQADASDDVLDELVEMGQRYSPVFNSITKGVPVSVRRSSD